MTEWVDQRVRSGLGGFASAHPAPTCLRTTPEVIDERVVIGSRSGLGEARGVASIWATGGGQWETKIFKKFKTYFPPSPRSPRHHQWPADTPKVVPQIFPTSVSRIIV